MLSIQVQKINQLWAFFLLSSQDNSPRSAALPSVSSPASMELEVSCCKNVPVAGISPLNQGELPRLLWISLYKGWLLFGKVCFVTILAENKGLEHKQIFQEKPA